MKIRLCASIFAFILLGGNLSASCFLKNPPKGWESIDDPSQLPQKVKIIYVGSGKSQFSPSINIACEETTMSPSEYVKLAKSYHEGQSDTKCCTIGKVETPLGSAEVLQIDRPSQWGGVRFIQAMVIHEGIAYVVTATCLKEEFGGLSSQFFKAIQSLQTD